jgi:hypothetical protein
LDFVAMKKNIPGLKLIEAENVPETAESERIMEGMVQQGAKLTPGLHLVLGMATPISPQKPREQNGTKGNERNEKRQLFKRYKVKRRVRDAGIAGSNPATPTK